MPDISEAEKFAFLRDGSPTANQPFQKRPGRALKPFVIGDLKMCEDLKDGHKAVVMFFVAELVGFFVKIATAFVFKADAVAHYFGQFGGAVRCYLFV
ncbi:hypothetical protein NEIELOOT_02468 [Neisseria elongata subsp. glycolytica ATCC 29315]|uniref:Uncharacterized protein n=1 Tax=Neisseria elongata subsp. glycolytica ATCC 29315 TaxID=546263 RepID=D4DTR2_NEIEG|nr:hypothetical protein NEIELOOT_02468 [Neisseria elongata subsp. glycolytica ATCC 29315]